MNEKVSVIISVYNVEKYISHSVESIIGQTYQNLEIILVDCASTDRSPEICEEIARKDSRIKVLHRTNGGLSEAKNAGLRVLTGDYVYFLEGGDYVEKSFIEIALSNAVATAADLVICNYNKVDEFNNLLAPVKFSTGIVNIEEHNRLSHIINSLKKCNSDWEVGNRFFKADLIRKNHLFFWDDKLNDSEDFGFLLNAALHASRISFIPEVLYYNLIRKDSAKAQSVKEPRIKATTELCRQMEEKIATSMKGTKIHKEYPVLFYAIMNEQLSKLTFYNYKKALSEIIDQRYFFKQVGRVIANFLLIIKYYGIVRGIEILLQCIFLKSGSLEKLSVFIINMANKRRKIQETIRYNQSKIFTKRRLFLIGCEDFWNLGDHHIAVSEIEYLQDLFPEYTIIEITASQYFAVNRLLPFVIKRKDLLCMHGGGNIGNYYMLAEQIRRDLLKKFRNNNKVIFPQTIHYSCSEEGKRELAEDQRIINRSRNLTLCLRERISYEQALQYFKCDLILTPDIVLYSDYTKKFDFERLGAMVILRSDVESILSQQDKLLIEKVAGEYTKIIRFMDTQLIIDINAFDRKEVVEEFVSKIAKAEFVITDRLHGMLFCAITQTPCIVLPNYNHKVEGVYEWISKLGYIKMIQNMDELEDAVDKLLKIDRFHYDYSVILREFDSLTKVLRSEVKEL